MSANSPDIRPDLANVEVPQVADFVGTRVFPIFNMPDKGGTLYYGAVQAITAAQAGRSAFAAPTAADVSSSSSSYTIVESILDARMTDDEVKQFGGLPAAEIAMARIVKQALLKAHDAKVKAILATAAGQDIMGSMSQAVDAGLIAIERTQGRKALVCGQTTFRRLCRYTEITNTLLRPNVENAMAMPVRNVSRETLAGILGLDEVIVGQDDPWTAGEAWVVTLPPDNSPSGTPKLGVTLQYMPDGVQPYLFEAFYSTAAVAQYVRGRNWQLPKALNLSYAAYHLRGIDEGNVVTTSTTTT
jgi:hypothetical protein